MDLSFILNELGEERDLYFRAVSPPISQTSNFAFETVDALRESFEDEYSTWLYSRGRNPTVDILCKKLAALDDAEDALTFNSGAAAIFAAVLSQIKSGDHIVCVKGVYTWAQRMFNEILPRFNVSVSYIDGTDIVNFEKATKANTVLYYLESPNSWTYELQDLKSVATLAKSRNIITICDNSYCTPIFQKPIQLGIDLSLQSATKYIGGHSDVIAGVLSGSSKLIQKIFNSEYMNIGSGIQPFNAWLLIRGLRTLPVRLNYIAQTTIQVLEYLKNHPAIERVIYPFDKDFAQHQLAITQMSNACGLLTFVLKASTVYQVEQFCNNLKHILMAVSWGGHESLIIPRCAGIKRVDFDPKNDEHRMLRLYVGLESPEYIINDLKQALEEMGK